MGGVGSGIGGVQDVLWSIVLKKYRIVQFEFLVVHDYWCIFGLISVYACIYFNKERGK